MNAMVLPVMALLALAGLTVLAFTACSCVWLYKDCRRYGQPPLLWVLLAVFASPILALLLYFIFARKSPLAPCPACGEPQPAAARYCQSCGAENPAFGQAPPPARLGRLGWAAVICAAVSVLCFIGLIGGTVLLALGGGSGGSYRSPTGAAVQPQANLPIENAFDVNTGWVLIGTEGHSGGVWSFSMNRTSDGYHVAGRFTLDEPKSRILAADVASEGGELKLEICQDGRLVRTESLTGSELRYFQLGDLAPGEVTLRVVNHGAADIQGRLWVE